MNERDHDLDNWKVVIKRAIDIEAKAAWQAFLLERESNAYSFYSHKPLYNKESKDQENSEANKYNSFTNNNSGSGMGGQSS